MSQTARALLLIAALCGCCTAGPAAAVQAATLRYEPVPECRVPDYACPGAQLTYTAGAGEANALRVEPAAADRSTGPVVREARLPLAAPAGCEQVDASTVRCPAQPTGITVALGDGDDTAELGGAVEVADGGAGNDRITGVGRLGRGGAGADVLEASPSARSVLDGGAGGDRLVGGPQDDELAGGGGRDVLLGGDGRDTLTGDDGDGAADDVLDGGPGVDTVAYRDRDAALLIEVGASGTGGESGERDRLVAIEEAEGGRGPDELVGDAGPNRLLGGPGDDLLEGHGGDDRLVGAGGRDSLIGAAGADALAPGGVSRGAGAEVADAVLCGAGADVVEAVAGRVTGVLARDCEELLEPRNGARLLAQPSRRTASSLTVRVRCSGRCRGRVEVRAAADRRLLAARAYALPGGGHAVLVRARLPLPRARLDVRLVQRSTPTADVRWRLPALGERTGDLLGG